MSEILEKGIKEQSGELTTSEFLEEIRKGGSKSIFY